MEEDIIYLKGDKRFSRSQLIEKYGNRVDEAINSFGFTVEQNEGLDRVLELPSDKVYEKKGVYFSQAQLTEKYGNRTDEAIEKFGFTEAGMFDEPNIYEPVKKNSDSKSSVQDPSLDSASNGDKETYGDQAFRSLSSGSARLWASLSSINESVYNLAALLPNAALYLAGREDMMLSSEKFKKDLGIVNPILDYYEAEIKKLGEETQVFNEENYSSSSISTNIANKNYGDAFQLLGSGMLESAPTSVAMMAGGFATTASTVAVGGTLMFMEENRKTLLAEDPEMNELESSLKAFGMAGAEGVFSSIGTGTIGKVYKDIVLKEGVEQGGIIFKQGLVESYKTALLKYGAVSSSVGEGLEEVATTVTQNLISGKPAFENATDSFIQGVGGGTVYGAPLTVNNIKNNAQDYIQRGKIKDMIKTSESQSTETLATLFSKPKEPLTELQLNIAKSYVSRRVLEKDLQKGIKDGSLTKGEVNQALAAFDQAKILDKAVDGAGLEGSSKLEAVNLLKRKQKLLNLTEGKDPFLFKNTNEEIGLINQQLTVLVNNSQVDKQTETPTNVPQVTVADAIDEIDFQIKLKEKELTETEGGLSSKVGRVFSNLNGNDGYKKEVQEKRGKIIGEILKLEEEKELLANPSTSPTGEVADIDGQNTIRDTEADTDIVEDGDDFQAFDDDDTGNTTQSNINEDEDVVDDSDEQNFILNGEQSPVKTEDTVVTDDTASVVDSQIQAQQPNAVATAPVQSVTQEQNVAQPSAAIATAELNSVSDQKNTVDVDPKNQESILNSSKDLLGDIKLEGMTLIEYDKGISVDDVLLIKGINSPNYEASFRGYDANGNIVIYRKDTGDQFTIEDKNRIIRNTSDKKIINNESIESIQYILENNVYDKWIAEGRMSVQDVVKVIESAGLNVPKSIAALNDINNEAAAQANTTPNTNVRPTTEPSQQRGQNDAVQPTVEADANKVDESVEEPASAPATPNASTAPYQSYDVKTRGDRWVLKRNSRGMMVVFDRKTDQPADVSQNLKQRYRNLYINDTDFTQGKLAFDESISLNDGGRSEQQIILDNSDNPTEIAIALTTTDFSQYTTFDPVQEAIARAVANGGVDKASFINAVGVNGAEGITRKYFSNKNTKGEALDMIAMAVEYEIYDDYNSNGERVTTDMIAEFMLRNPSGVTEFFTAKPIERELKARFEEITGLPATPRILDIIASRGVDKLYPADTTTANVDDYQYDPNDHFVEFGSDTYMSTDDDLPFQQNRTLKTSSKEVVEKLVSKIKQAFPNVEVVIDQDAFDQRLAEINSDKASKGKPLSNKNGVYGFADLENNKVFLNPSKLNMNTPVHEFGHIWVNSLKDSNPELYKRGIELIKGTKYYDEVKNNPSYKDLTDEQILEEALVSAIGDKGEQFLNQKQKSAFREFLNKIKDFVTSKFFKDRETELSKLSLNQFLNGAVNDILGGKDLRITSKIGAVQFQKMGSQANISSSDFDKIEQNKQEKIVLDAIEIASAKIKASLTGRLNKVTDRLTGKINKATNVRKEAIEIRNQLVDKLKDYIKEDSVLDNLNFGDFKRISQNISKATDLTGLIKATEVFNKIKERALAKGLAARIKAAELTAAQTTKVASQEALSKAVKKELRDFIKSEITDSDVRAKLSDTDIMRIESVIIKAKTEVARLNGIETFTNMVNRAKEKVMKDQQAKMDADARKQAIKERKEELAKIVKDFEADFFKNKINQGSVRVMKKREVARIYKKLAAAKTPRTVQNAIDSLTDLFYELEGRKAMLAINKLLSRQLTKLESGRRKLNGIDERSAKTLLHVKSIIKQQMANRRDGVRPADADKEVFEILTKEYNELLNKSGNITEEDLQRTQGLHIALGIIKAKFTTDKKSQTEMLKDSLVNLSQIWDSGKTGYAVWLEQRRKRISDSKDPMIDATSMEKNPTQRSIAEIESNQKGWLKALSKGVYNTLLGNSLGDLITLFRVIDMKGSREINDSPWTDMHERIIGTETEKTYALRQHAKTIKEAQSRIFGIKLVGNTKKFSELIMTTELGRKHILTVREKPQRDDDNRPMKDKNGKPLTQTYTNEFSESQMLYLQMQYKNPETHPSFDASGYNAEFMKELDKKLSEKSKEYGDFLFAFYDKQYAPLNETYKKMYGFSLGRPKYYAGKLTHVGFSETEINLMDANRIAQTTAGTSLKERGGAAMPIDAADVNRTLSRYIYESEHFKAYAEVHQEFNAVIESPTFKRALYNAHPKLASSLMAQLVYYRDKDMVRGGTQHLGFEIMDVFMSNFVKSTLAFKPRIALTQTISWTNAVSFLPSGKYAFIGYNPNNFLTDLKHIMKNSKYISNRWDGEGLAQAVTGLNSITTQNLFQDSGIVGTSAKQLARVYDAAQNVLMFNIKAGDMVGVSGSIPVYSGWKQKYLDQGFSAAKAEIKAMRKFESAVERAQQSQTGYGKSMLQSHPAGRYFAMFATSVLQNYRNAMLSYMELYRHATKRSSAKGGIIRHIATITNYSIVQPLVYTFLSQRLLGLDFLFGDDEEDRELIDEEKSMIAALILGNTGALPVIGPALTLLTDTVLMDAIGVGAKENTYGGILSNPLSDEGTKLESNIKAYYNAKTPETAAKNLAKIKKSVLKLSSGLPVEAAENYIPMIFDMIENSPEYQDKYDMVDKFWLLMGNTEKTMEFDKAAREAIKGASSTFTSGLEGNEVWKDEKWSNGLIDDIWKEETWKN